MNFKLLALTAAIALTGCASDDADFSSVAGSSGTQAGMMPAGSTTMPGNTGNTGNMGNTGGGTTTQMPTNPTPPAQMPRTISGPLDPVQTAVSEQLLGALIDAARNIPEPLPVAQLLTCVDNTVSQRTLDVVDSLAAAATTQNPQPVVQGLEDLLGSVAGLLLSLAPGSDGNCQVNLAGLAGGGAGGLPTGGLPTTLPPELAAIPGIGPLLTQLQSIAGGSGAPSPEQLTQLAGQLSVVSQGLTRGATLAGSAPLVPAVLLTVAELVDDLAVVLGAPTQAPANVQNLVENLVSNLQDLPAGLVPGGLPTGTTPGTGGSTNPLAGVPLLGDLAGAFQGLIPNGGALPGMTPPAATTPAPSPLAQIPVLGPILDGLVGGLLALAPR